METKEEAIAECDIKNFGGTYTTLFKFTFKNGKELTIFWDTNAEDGKEEGDHFLNMQEYVSVVNTVADWR
jgi:hypothetical protein